MVASNEVLPNPYVSAGTLKACALISLHLLAGDDEVGLSGSQSPDFGMGVEKKPDLEQPLFGKCHLW